MSTTRRVLALAAAAAGIAGALAMAAPVQAESHRTTEQVFFSADADTCWATPDASTTGTPASVRPVLGSLYKATPAEYDGVGVGRGDDTFRWIEITPGHGCYVAEDQTSAAVQGDLDPSTWKVQAVVAPGSRGMGMGAVLNAGDRTLHAAPSAVSKALTEVAEGEVLLTSGWSIDGGNPSISGRKVWAPVVYRGVMAWIPASSLAPIPSYTVSDLTSRITPEHLVTVRAQPSGSADPLGEIAAGDTAPALQTATVGWIPVGVDGRVGWVAEADLLSSPDASPTSEPSASASPSTALDRASEQYAAWKARHDSTGKPRILDKIRRADNPVVRAAAQARIWPATFVAAFALLVAFGGLAARRLAGLTIAARAAGMLSLPVASLLALWATSLAPSHYLQARVLGGTVLVGAVLGTLCALRVAGSHKAQIARGQWTVLVALAVGALATTFVRWGMGAGAASSLLVGLLACGASVGGAARLAPVTTPEKAVEVVR